MIDRFGRTIECLRVSVTDRCNLRCRYCVRGDRAPLLPAASLLFTPEIVEVCQVAVAQGISRIRLTGGEPLLRSDLEDLVSALASLDGVQDLAMTTNGTLLADHAADLAAAGLHRVNVSLDTLDPERFRWLTRGGDLASVLAGIEAAREAGLHPLKLNCVVTGDEPPGEVDRVRDYGDRHDLRVRIIHMMDFTTGRFSVVEGGSGGDCSRCDRLRVCSNGEIRPCLFSDLAFSMRALGPAEALHQAVAAKPARGGPCEHDWIRGIGG
jgi:cyclic pyranopterin phosphate synthase